VAARIREHHNRSIGCQPCLAFNRPNKPIGPAPRCDPNLWCGTGLSAWSTRKNRSRFGTGVGRCAPAQAALQAPQLLRDLD
jgi:hypothetical protein